MYGKVPIPYPREKMSLIYRYDLINLSALIISTNPSLLIISEGENPNEILAFERAIEVSKQNITLDSSGRLTISEFADLQRHGLFLIEIQKEKQDKKNQWQPPKIKTKD